MDNTVFSPNTIWRVTIIESELHAQTILDHYGGVSRSDVYYSNTLGYMGYDTQAFCGEVATQDLQDMKGDLVLVRDTIRRDPFMLFSTPYKLGYDLKDAMNIADFGQIYDSGAVYAYLWSRTADYFALPHGVGGGIFFLQKPLLFFADRKLKEPIVPSSCYHERL